MLNCLIIDDEPLARRHIEEYIGRVPFLKLAGSARNPVVGKAILDTEAVDLVFLDIKMPKMTGIELLRNNNILQQIIFITAYPEYAIDGFDLEVTDYLLKPVTFERFLKACEKAYAKVGGDANLRSLNDQPGFIYVRVNQRFEKIRIAEILFVESMLNYVHIVTQSGRLTVYSSLKAIENILPKEDFTRVHKSYVVANTHIGSIAGHEVRLYGYTIPVSRTNRRLVSQIVDNKQLK